MAIFAGVAFVTSGWLDAHPEHNPWAPLDLRDPVGWATAGKISNLRNDAAACRATLVRSDIAFEQLPSAGTDECLREDRTVLLDAPLSPDKPVSTCMVGAAFEIWMQASVRPSAETMLGSPIQRLEHLGTYSCRRLYGRSEGDWSQHSTGNAIDISAFVLEDGRRISVAARLGRRDGGERVPGSGSR